MATFLTTVRFTSQGMRDIQATCQRADALHSMAAKMGVEMKHIFWTLGAFDGAVLFEAPDDETASAFMLKIGSLGNVTTQTMRAYEAAEMERILAKISG